MEIDSNATLPSVIQVNIEDFDYVDVSVEYLWKPKFCTLCNKSGHVDYQCRNAKEVWKPRKGATVKEASTATQPMGNAAHAKEAPQGSKSGASSVKKAQKGEQCSSPAEQTTEKVVQEHIDSIGSKSNADSVMEA